MAKNNNYSMYLLAIVGIVAVVGIVLMVNGCDFSKATSKDNTDTTNVEEIGVSEDVDLVGQAYRGKTRSKPKPAYDETKCFDSDGGKDYFVNGYAKDANSKKQDICFDQSYLYEAYCRNNRDTYTKKACEFGCEDGVCLKEPEQSLLCPGEFGWTTCNYRYMKYVGPGTDYFLFDLTNNNDVKVDLTKLKVELETNGNLFRPLFYGEDPVYFYPGESITIVIAGMYNPLVNSDYCGVESAYSIKIFPIGHEEDSNFQSKSFTINNCYSENKGCKQKNSYVYIKDEVEVLGNVGVDSCVTENGIDFVLETFCDDGSIKSNKIKCENGCEDGACVDVDLPDAFDPNCLETGKIFKCNGANTVSIAECGINSETFLDSYECEEDYTEAQKICVEYSDVEANCLSECENNDVIYLCSSNWQKPGKPHEYQKYSCEGENIGGLNIGEWYPSEEFIETCSVENCYDKFGLCS